MCMDCLCSLLRAAANYKGTSVVYISSSADEPQKASMQYNGTHRLPSAHFSSQSHSAFHVYNTLPVSSGSHSKQHTEQC